MNILHVKLLITEPENYKHSAIKNVIELPRITIATAVSFSKLLSKDLYIIFIIDSYLKF